MNRNQTLAVIVGILIVAGLLFAGYNGMLKIGLQGTTSNNLYYGANDGSVISEIKNKPIYGGSSAGGELTPQDTYLSTWLSSQYGEKIIISPHADYWNAWWNGILGGGAFNQPGVLIGRYWLTATLTDASGTHNIIWAGGFDNKYLEIAPDSPTQQSDIHAIFGDFDKRTWASLYGQYKNAWGGWYGTNGPTQSDGWNKWWSDPIRQSYSKYELGLQGTPVAFYMKAGVEGTVLIQVHSDYATWHQYAINNARYELHEDVILQSDSFVIKSAQGNLDIANYNVYQFKGPAEAGGTLDVYTKYVFTEGSQVKLNIDVDYSRPELYKGWKVDVIKPGNLLLQEFAIPDNINKSITFTIPDKSFVAGGNNEWTVQLVNPALKYKDGTTLQAEIKLFVVDTYAHAPSGTNVTTNGNYFSQGSTVAITCTAWRNQVTKSVITQFRLFIRLNNPTNGEYLFDGVLTSLTQSGEKFTGTYNFKLNRMGTVYIEALAQDTGGYTGGEGITTVTVTSAPAYSIVVVVTDKTTTKPIQYAMVTLGTIQKPTRSDGSATFDVLSGQYALVVEKSGYPTYSGGVIQIGKSQEIPVALYGGMGPNPQPGGQYPLNVAVVDSQSNVITGASVTVGDEMNTTDINGYAHFSLSTLQEYNLTVTADGYETYYDTITEDVLNAGYFLTTLIGTGTVPNETGTYPLTITVVDGLNNAVISGASIAIGDKTGTTTTDGIASFTFNEKKEYAITVVAKGYTTVSDTATSEDFDNTIKYVSMLSSDLNTTTQTIVMIYVTDSFGHAINNAFVDFGDNVHFGFATNGKAVFNTIPNGDYTMTIMADGYDELSQVLSVNGTVSQTYILTPTIPTPIHQDPNDQTPDTDKYNVTITVTNGDASTIVKIDKAFGYGSVINFKISSGTHTLTVGKPGYAVHTEQITIPGKLSYSVTLKRNGTPATPGFEAITLIVAIGISLVIIYKRKKKEEE